MSLAAWSRFSAIISLPASSGSVRRLAVVQVGRQRHEPLGGEAVAHVLDVRHEPPPLLDHHQPGSGARCRHRQIPRAGATVGGELHHLSHDERRYLSRSRPLGPTPLGLARRPPAPGPPGHAAARGRFVAVPPSDHGAKLGANPAQRAKVDPGGTRGPTVERTARIPGHASAERPSGCLAALGPALGVESAGVVRGRGGRARGPRGGGRRRPAGRWRCARRRG